MTREEFITKYTELTAAQAAANPEFAAFRDAVLQDYDALDQANTSLEAIIAEHQTLNENYSKLQSAYTRLYMTNPAIAPTPANPIANPEPTNPTPEPIKQPEGPTIDTVLHDLTAKPD